MRRFALKPFVLGFLLCLGLGTRAAAYPLLQLDIANGVYNTTLQETVATSRTSTLDADLTNPTAQELAATSLTAPPMPPKR